MSPESPARKHTMEDVAVAAGVSRASVSRVLLGQNKVSDETRRKVRAAAERMGYVPNVMASELASRETRTVGLLLRDAANPAYGLLFTELQKAAHDQALTLVSMTIGADVHGEQQVASLHRLVGMRVAALIVATGGVSSEQLEPFLPRTPIVRAGRPETTDIIHAISYDEENAGRQLAEHVAAAGHRDVAVLMTAETTSYPEFVRSTTMASVLAERGVRVTPIAVQGPEDGVVEVTRLARERAVSAVMCPSDTRQLAVLSRLRSVGLAVPDDVSVSGCDGVMPGLELLGLTTLRVPVAELARRTVALVARLVGDEPPATVVQERLPGTLLPGSTVRAVPVDDLRTPMSVPALPASRPDPGSPG